MVKLIVYGSPVATCTQRVLILLEELQLKYTLQEVNLLKGEHKDPKYLFLQPFGKVPSVRYDNDILFESRSILRYIAKNNNDDIDLTLEDSVYVDMWLEAESQNFNPVISTFAYEKIFKKWFDSDAEVDDKIVNQSVAELEKVFDVYEKRLEKSKYLGGDAFSIADISHIPYLHLFVTAGSEYKQILKKYHLVYKWYKKLISRESVKYVLNID